MKGIIIVDKEKNVTSRDVVNSLCKILGTKKVGHTGTLDPLATGVLIICFGKYTKLVDLITSQNKEYIATVKLGILTDTLDITGDVTEENKKIVSKNEVMEALKFYSKVYEQEVPKYSAVRIGGKKLYEYARNNEEVELPKRMVNIFDLELLDFSGDTFKFRANVSKGTYIRSLINDICIKMNTVGVMSDLVRTKQGNIEIENSYSIDDIKNNNYKILSAREVLNIPLISLSKEEVFLVTNGVKIEKNIDDGLYLMIYENEEIAVYEFFSNIGKMKVYLKD